MKKLLILLIILTTTITLSFSSYAKNKVKPYKINTKYFKCLGKTYSSLDELKESIGSFSFTKKWDKHDNATVKNKKGDLFELKLGVNYNSNPISYEYNITFIKTKAKKLFNIKNATSKKIFMKKMKKKKYDCSFSKKKHVLYIIKGKTTYTNKANNDKETYYVKWKINLTKKNKIKPSSAIKLELTENNEIG